MHKKILRTKYLNIVLMLKINKKMAVTLYVRSQKTYYVKVFVFD